MTPVQLQRLYTQSNEIEKWSWTVKYLAENGHEEASWRYGRTRVDIKISLKNRVWKGGPDWSPISVSVNTVMNIWVLKNAGQFLTSWANISFRKGLYSNKKDAMGWSCSYHAREGEKCIQNFIHKELGFLRDVTRLKGGTGFNWQKKGGGGLLWTRFYFRVS
jgi:hypothetical protein